MALSQPRRNSPRVQLAVDLGALRNDESSWFSTYSSAGIELYVDLGIDPAATNAKSGQDGDVCSKFHIRSKGILGHEVREKERTGTFQQELLGNVCVDLGIVDLEVGGEDNSGTFQEELFSCTIPVEDGTDEVRGIEKTSTYPEEPSKCVDVDRELGGREKPGTFLEEEPSRSASVVEVIDGEFGGKRSGISRVKVLSNSNHSHVKLEAGHRRESGAPEAKIAPGQQHEIVIVDHGAPEAEKSLFWIAVDRSPTWNACEARVGTSGDEVAEKTHACLGYQADVVECKAGVVECKAGVVEETSARSKETWTGPWPDWGEPLSPDWGDPLPPEEDDDEELRSAPLEDKDLCKKVVTFCEEVAVVHPTDVQEERETGSFSLLGSSDDEFERVADQDTSSSKPKSTKVSFSARSLADMSAARQLVELSTVVDCEDTAPSQDPQMSLAKVHDAGAYFLDEISGIVEKIYTALYDLRMRNCREKEAWKVETVSEDSRKLRMKRVKPKDWPDFSVGEMEVDEERDVLDRPPWKRQYRSVGAL